MPTQEILDTLFSNSIFENLNQNDLINTFHNITISTFITATCTSTSSIIDEIPPNGIVINTPGKYTFNSNIKWKPNSDAIAITITASDVSLDLNNFSLKNYSSKLNNKTVGIYLNHVSNVTIKNGNIKHMNYYGMQGAGCNNITINNIKVTDIQIADLNTRFLTPCGIFMSESTNVNICDSRVKDMNVTSDSSAGIQLFECSNSNITNTQVKNITNNDGAVQGFSTILCSNLNINNCSSDKLESFFNGNILTSGHTVLGFCPILCINCVYENCEATNQKGCCDDCHGISVFLDAFITLINFKVKNIIDGIPKTGAKSTGIEIYGIGCLVTNCHVENIIAINPQDKQAAGFSCAGFNNTFDTCTAKNVTVVDEENKRNKKIGLGVGFGWAPDPRPSFRNLYAVNTSYVNCAASYCQVGFDTFNHINSSWNNIEAYLECKKCILIKPGASRFLSCNPCSECNPYINCIVVNAFSNNEFDNIRCSEIECPSCG